MSEDAVIYVCSSGRSGSTLLDLLLGSHSNAFSLGEIEHLPKNLALDTPCSCGATARSCEFWATAVEQLCRDLRVDVRGDPYRLNLGFYLATRVIDPSHQTERYKRRRRFVLALKHAEYAGWVGSGVLRVFGRDFEEGVRNTLRLYEVVRKNSNKRVLIDSSKEYRKAIALFKARPKQVKVILLHRDGRGVFYSKKKSGFSAQRCVKPWVRFYSRAIPLLNKHIPDECLVRVRYEDLAGAPEATIKGVCERVGLSFEKKMLDFREATHHVLNGNEMRLKDVSGIRVDDAWRRQLTDQELAYFERVAGDMNRRLGYLD